MSHPIFGSQLKGKRLYHIGNQLGNYVNVHFLSSGNVSYYGRFVETQEVFNSFLRVARVASILQGNPHPNLHLPCDFVVKDNHVAIISEALAGDVLSLVETDSGFDVFSPLEAVAFVRDVASGLTFLHQNGILHRDLKLENILYDVHTGRYKISDFDISLPPNRRKLDETGVLGSYAYFTPEMITSFFSNVPNTTEKREDVYQLSVSLFILLTGKIPFFDQPYTRFGLKITHTFLEAILNNPICADFLREKNVPEPAIAVLQKAMEKDPEKRYQTARELASAFEAAVKKPN